MLVVADRDLHSYLVGCRNCSTSRQWRWMRPQYQSCKLPVLMACIPCESLLGPCHRPKVRHATFGAAAGEFLQTARM